MRFYLHFLFILIIQTHTYSQSRFNFSNDTTYKVHNSKLINLISTSIPEKSEFQIRFWHHDNNVNIVRHDYLLLATFSNSSWHFQKFTFADKYSSNIEVIKDNATVRNFDSLFNDLLSDSLYSIVSWSDFKVQQEAKKRGIGGLAYVSEGGIDYTVELLTPKSRRSFTLNCPNSYFKFYGLSELKNPIKIITVLLKIWNGATPC